MAAAASAHKALEVLRPPEPLGSDFPSYVDAVDASLRLAWAAAAPRVDGVPPELLYANDAKTTRRRSTVFCAAPLPRQRAPSRTLWIRGLRRPARANGEEAHAAHAGIHGRARRGQNPPCARRGCRRRRGATLHYAAAAAGQTAVARLLLKRGAKRAQDAKASSRRKPARRRRAARAQVLAEPRGAPGLGEVGKSSVASSS